ncbi:hypothetical protein V6N13_142299 [Hibiscus sabdariffa]|uniref:Uncharacterized protein n=2 Tax=Hibiscus sabdariffa TaxID=183260 RepID=A0ABR2FDU7_9ROSI
MPFIEGDVDALSSTTNLRVLALLLTRTTVVVVRRQIHALVAAAKRGGAASHGARLSVFPAMTRRSRVVSLKETARPCGRQWRLICHGHCDGKGEGNGEVEGLGSFAGYGLESYW